MDRNVMHPFDASAKLPVRQKEVKFDSLMSGGDDRVVEGGASKSEERRGFRPNTRIYAATGPRVRGRMAGPMEGGVGASHFAESAPIITEVLSEERVTHPSRQRARPPRLSEVPAEAMAIARGKTKHNVARPLPAAPVANAASRLLVEGSSMLSHDVGLASAALSHLSDCVAQERRLKEEWETARLAKVRALRSVVRVFMQSFTDQGSYARSTSVSGKVLSDTLAVARCSVVTNALVGTVQNFMRAFRSRQLCGMRIPVSGPHPLPNAVRRRSIGFATSFYTNVASSSVSNSYMTPLHSASDTLEEEEVSRLKQLYFDYFDCETVSISSALPSTSASSVLACEHSSPASRPVSSVSKSDLSEFSHAASTTL